MVQPQYDRVVAFSEGLAAVVADGKYGFIDTTGKTVIEPRYEFAEGFGSGLAPVKVGDTWGYIDKTGALVIQPTFYRAHASPKAWRWWRRWSTARRSTATSTRPAR